MFCAFQLSSNGDFKAPLRVALLRKLQGSSIEVLYWGLKLSIRALAWGLALRLQRQLGAQVALLLRAAAGLGVSGPGVSGPRAQGFKNGVPPAWRAGVGKRVQGLGIIKGLCARSRSAGLG